MGHLLEEEDVFCGVAEAVVRCEEVPDDGVLQVARHNVDRYRDRGEPMRLLSLLHHTPHARNPLHVQLEDGLAARQLHVVHALGAREAQARALPAAQYHRADVPCCDGVTAARKHHVSLFSRRLHAVEDVVRRYVADVCRPRDRRPRPAALPGSGEVMSVGEHAPALQLLPYGWRRALCDERKQVLL